MTRTCLSCCPGTLSGQGMLEVQGLASEIMHKTLTLALNDQPKAESLRYCCKVAIIVARLSAVWMSANSCTDSSSRAMTSYICSKETFFLWCCCERRSPMHLISHYWNFISNRQINTDFFLVICKNGCSKLRGQRPLQQYLSQKSVVSLTEKANFISCS